MSTRDKMYESNGKIRKWLVLNGFEDLHFFPHTRYSKDVHFKGLSFDGCCSYGKTFVLFQAKTNCKPTKKIQARMEIVTEASGVMLLWCDVVKRKGVQVYGFKPKDINTTDNI